MPPRADERTTLIDSSPTTELTTNYYHDHDDSSLSLKNTTTRFPAGGFYRRATFWNIICTTFVAATTVLFVHSRMMAVVQEVKTSSRRSTNSKYKRVQGIGFQIYTGGAPAFLNRTDGSSKLNPECLGRSSYGQVVGEIAPEIQCYIGHDDPMLDVQNRIEIMKEAVELAYKVADGDADILKVFIAPEFYWRGINGAYFFQKDEEPDDPSTCGPICQILQGMETIAAQKRFEDWLFLFGTIIALDVLPTDDPYDYLFYNFAPLYKGYDPTKVGFAGKRFLLPKRYVSSSDFLTPQRHLNASVFKELFGEQLPEHDTTVYNPHDFDQKRYDHSMWGRYKDELNSLGYVSVVFASHIRSEQGSHSQSFHSLFTLAATP